MISNKTVCYLVPKKCPTGNVREFMSIFSLNFDKRGKNKGKTDHVSQINRDELRKNEPFKPVYDFYHTRPGRGQIRVCYRNVSNFLVIILMEFIFVFFIFTGHGQSCSRTKNY